MIRPVPVIVNPTAGGGRLLKQRRALDEAAAVCDAELEWWYTEHPGHAEELGRQAASERRQLVLAFGGDGTYNEVARGLLGSSTALGALPGGTTSVLAYELGIPRPAVRALPALLEGSDRPMRVGRSSNGDIFLLMLSAGPDSMVLHRLFPLFKRLGGKLGVALQAVVEVLRARLPQLRVSIGNRSVQGGWAVIGNSRSYAGPFHATPGADPFADSLELVLLKSSSRRAVIPFALGIATGSHVRRSDVLQQAVARIRLEPAPGSAELHYQVDGDTAGLLPVEAWIDPMPLLMRLPQPLAGELLTVEGESFATL
jgi:diacylglycerol kinase family enzyme